MLNPVKNIEIVIKGTIFSHEEGAHYCGQYNLVLPFCIFFHVYVFSF